MRRAIFVVGMLALGGSAFAANPLVPSPTNQPPPPIRRESPLTRPIRFFWSEFDTQRVNEGLVGRKNALRDEQRVAITPSLQPRPLSAF